MKKIKVSIIGVTGYTGLELLKIIKIHPYIEIKHLVSHSHNGEKINDIYPHLESIYSQKMISAKNENDFEKIAAESDLIFFALPHGHSTKIIPKIKTLTNIIDLANDFRPKSNKNNFLYGLPELQKEKISKASLIANPGCFATAIELALLPIKEHIKEVSIQGITGSSGSGKSISQGSHHPIRNHNIKSYKITTHQHIPEIAETLSIQKEKITFVPTSGPFTRGIHTTAFIKTTKKVESEKTIKLYQTFYENHPFIRIKETVQLAEIIGSNFCDISINFHKDKIIIQTVIDNLIKGAAGTAIQNFNLMYKLPENTALKYLLPLYP